MAPLFLFVTAPPPRRCRRAAPEDARAYGWQAGWPSWSRSRSSGGSWRRAAVAAAAGMEAAAGATATTTGAGATRTPRPQPLVNREIERVADGTDRPTRPRTAAKPWTAGAAAPDQ
jgi:hypothetical protein